MRRVSGILAVLLLAPPALGGTPSLQRLASAYKASVQDYQDGKFRRAYARGKKLAAILTRSGASARLDEKVHLLLGKTARRLGEAALAVRHYKRARTRMQARLGAESPEVANLERLVMRLQAPEASEPTDEKVEAPTPTATAPSKPRPRRRSPPRPLPPVATKPLSPRRVDRWGEPLGPGVLRRLGGDPLKLPKAGARIALAPDGSRLWVGTDKGELRLWDVATGKVVLAPDYPGKMYRPNPAPGPTPGLIVGCDDGAVRFLDAATGATTRTVRPQGWPAGKTIYRPMYAPGSDTFALWRREDFRLFDASSGKLRREIRPSDSYLGVPALSPTGTRASGTRVSGNIRFWDTETGAELEGVPAWPAKGSAQQLQFSPDGRTYAYKYQAPNSWRFQVRKVDSHELVLDLDLHLAWSNSIHYLDDGKRVLAAGSGGARVFDLATGKETLVVPLPFASIQDVAVSPDETKLAARVNDTEGGVWDLATGKELFYRPHHRLPVTGAVFSLDEARLVTFSPDRGIVWDLETGESLRTLRAPPPDREASKWIGSPIRHTAGPVSWGVSDTPPAITLGYLGSREIFRLDRTTLEPLAGCTETGEARGHPYVGPDASDLVRLQITLGHLTVLDPATCTPIASHDLSEQKNYPDYSHVTLAPHTDVLLSLVREGRARLWHLATGRHLGSYRSRPLSVKASQWDRAGARLYVLGIDGTLDIVDTRELLGEEPVEELPVLRLPGGASQIVDVQPSADGSSFYLVRGRHRLERWRAAGPTREAVTDLSGRVLRSVTPSPSEKLLVAAYEDGRVEVLDAAALSWEDDLASPPLASASWKRIPPEEDTLPARGSSYERVDAKAWLAKPETEKLTDLVERIQRGSAGGYYPLVNAAKRLVREREVHALLVKLLTLKLPEMNALRTSRITVFSDDGVRDLEGETTIDDSAFKEELLYAIRDGVPPESPLLEGIFAAYEAEERPMMRMRIVRALGKIGGTKAQGFLRQVIEREKGTNSPALQEATRRRK